MIRVFRLNDVVKFLVKLVILVIGVILFTRFFNAIKKWDFNSFIQSKLNELKERTFIEYLEENFNDFTVEDKINEQNVISKELDFIRSTLSTDVAVTSQENVAVEENISEEISNDIQESPETQVLEEHNKKDVYDITYSTVQIRNQTSTELTEEMLTPDVEIAKDNIVIFHTHTSESYTPTDANPYQASRKFPNFRYSS